LLKGRAGKTTIEADEAIFTKNHPNCVQRGLVSLCASRVVNEGRLDTLSRRHRENRSQNSSTHPSEHVPAGGKGPRLAVLESILHRVKAQKPHRILANAPDDEHTTALVKRPQTFLSIDARDDRERVPWRFRITPQLHPRLRVFRGECDKSFDLGAGKQVSDNWPRLGKQIGVLRKMLQWFELPGDPYATCDAARDDRHYRRCRRFTFLLAHSEVRAAVGRGHWLGLAIEEKCTHGQERERYINNTSKREESVGKTPDSPPTCGYAQLTFIGTRQ